MFYWKFLSNMLNWVYAKAHGGLRVDSKYNNFYFTIFKMLMNMPSINALSFVKK